MGTEAENLPRGQPRRNLCGWLAPLPRTNLRSEHPWFPETRMRVEWTSYSSPVGALTVVECEAGPLVVEFPHRAATVKWAVRLRAADWLPRPWLAGALARRRGPG